MNLRYDERLGVSRSSLLLSFTFIKYAFIYIVVKYLNYFFSKCNIWIPFATFENWRGKEGVHKIGPW